jgi:hypothetical protein
MHALALVSRFPPGVEFAAQAVGGDNWSEALDNQREIAKMTAAKSEKVPKALEARFAEIVQITDAFAAAHLNEEYRLLIRYAVAALCRKRPSPLATGKGNVWACGVSHAIGSVNFLFDRSQTPHMTAGELYETFGVSQGTGQGKSKLVRDTLKMGRWTPIGPCRADWRTTPWLGCYRLRARGGGRNNRGPFAAPGVGLQCPLHGALSVGHAALMRASSGCSNRCPWSDFELDQRVSW